MKSISYITALILTLFLGSSLAKAQPGIDEDNPRIAQLKIAYLTERINLSPQEAEKFWPTYNQYARAQKQLRREMRMDMQNLKMNLEDMSEEELRNSSDMVVEMKRKELKILETYHPKFKELLPPKKLLRFYKAESEFPKWVLMQIRQRQGTPGTPGRRNGNFRRND
jgi:hypothetical protein